MSSTAPEYVPGHGLLKDKVVAVFGGLTSASREAIRPIMHRAKIP